jgi:hypothetical protein
MASKIDYAIRVTPIYEYSGGEGNSVHSIASDFGKSFGGGGAVASPSYTNGTTATSNVSTSATTLATTPTSCKGIFVKNTGLDDTNTATVSTVTVSVGGVQIAVLAPSGAIFLPSPESSTAFTAASSSGTVKVEYATFD